MEAVVNKSHLFSNTRRHTSAHQEYEWCTNETTRTEAAHGIVDRYIKLTYIYYCLLTHNI